MLTQLAWCVVQRAERHRAAILRAASLHKGRSPSRCPPQCYCSVCTMRKTRQEIRSELVVSGYAHILLKWNGKMLCINSATGPRPTPPLPPSFPPYHRPALPARGDLRLRLSPMQHVSCVQRSGFDSGLKCCARTCRRGVGGSIVGVIGVGQDITEMRRLMKQEALLAKVTSS
jgi:hypothetical protein